MEIIRQSLMWKEGTSFQDLLCSKKLLTQQKLVEIFFSGKRDFTQTAFAQKLVRCNFFGPLSND